MIKVIVIIIDATYMCYVFIFFKEKENTIVRKTQNFKDKTEIYLLHK